MNFEILGLNNRDKRVYEALLIEPMNSVRGLAEQTSINRGSVFESIKDLQAIGMVSYVKVGARHKYTAESPERLHEIINEKRRELRDTHSVVDDYVAFEATSTFEKYGSTFCGILRRRRRCSERAERPTDDMPSTGGG